MNFIKRHLFWILLTLFVVSACSLDVFVARPAQAKKQQELYQAIYDAGLGVGKTRGYCEALKLFADGNPDLAWSNTDDTKTTLLLCDKLLKETAPGTKKRIDHVV